MFVSLSLLLSMSESVCVSLEMWSGVWL